MIKIVYDLQPSVEPVCQDGTRILAGATDCGRIFSRGACKIRPQSVASVPLYGGIRVLLRQKCKEVL